MKPSVVVFTLFRNVILAGHEPNRQGSAIDRDESVALIRRADYDVLVEQSEQLDRWAVEIYGISETELRRREKSVSAGVFITLDEMIAKLRAAGPSQGDGISPGEHEPEEPLTDDRLPRIAGDRITQPLDAFERACLVLLFEEQEKPNASSALIATLCDAVRLSRQAAKGQRENGGAGEAGGLMIP